MSSETHTMKTIKKTIKKFTEPSVDGLGKEITAICYGKVWHETDLYGNIHIQDAGKDYDPPCERYMLTIGNEGHTSGTFEELEQILLEWANDEGAFTEEDFE